MNDPEAVLASLRAQGLVRERATMTPLSGGVSCDVWRVIPTDTPADVQVAYPSGLVVKSPLARLRVPGVWEADTSRGLAEARALELYGRLTPAFVPRMVWLDATGPVLVMESAPLDWAEWRDQLLDPGTPEEFLSADRFRAIGTLLGQTLSAWHERTREVEALPVELRSGDRLRTLRTNPLHRATAEQAPALATDLEALAVELEDTAECLVHGDFSPKNFLVDPRLDGKDPRGLWVLDAEVAHVGNPVLDVAYLSAHLLLKATRRPELTDALDIGRRAFEQAYRSECAMVDPRDWSRHTGAILAARVLGLSRVTYLDEDQQVRILDLASALIRGELTLDGAWALAAHR